MLDLNKIMNETLVKIEEEKFIEGVMEKQLKEEIESKLKLDLSNLDLASYSQIMVNAVHRELDNQIQTSAIEKLKEETKNLLKHSKDKYTLSEIIKKLKPEDPEESGCVALNIDDHGSLIFIRFDEEDKTFKHQFDYGLTIHRDGRIHSIDFERKDPSKKLKFGSYYGVEELLMGAYVNGAKIELDEGTDPDDYDTSYGDDY